ncbi:MAG: response regulator [Rhodocyclaceae bacterium]|jgi:two-component system chemotaxis response regulator CheY|nr:response regulator [Rhodocyclaceae bacterium]MBK6908356.1 response regulator [Rhodocyclaceae bacterium]
MTRKKLLVVDDSTIIRNHIARLLGDPRLPNLDIVGLASDGEKALAAARDKRPDLITMDLTMPNMDGEACIEAVAKILPETRILVVSALSDNATALRALTKGAHGFLQKPFTDDSLIAALLELME